MSRILAVITRQTILIGGLQIEKISTATTARWHAFELLGARLDPPGADTNHSAGNVNPLQARGVSPPQPT
jgi:hypothetical protein